MAHNELRRNWLRHSVTLALGVTGLMIVPGLVGQEKGNTSGKGEEDEVSPAEDLMREHGILKRVLLIYPKVMNRIDSKQNFPPDVVLSSAKLIRAFVEDYH